MCEAVATPVTTSFAMSTDVAVKSAGAVRSAVEKVLAGGRVRTPDLGGTHTTTDMGDAVLAAVG